MDDNVRIATWVRKNKKRIAGELIKDIPYPPNQSPTAIITAGLPGAGKTEFIRRLKSQLNIDSLHIDMDEIAKQIEGYRPQIADKFRAGASSIMNTILDSVLNKGIDYILDGTFGGSPALNNITRSLDHGYKIKIYYIYQEPLIAWRFTQAREKEEHRSIKKSGFINTYFKIYSNLSQLSQFKHRVAFGVVIKNPDNQTGNVYDNVEDILQLIPSKMTRIELENLLT